MRKALFRGVLIATAVSVTVLGGRSNAADFVVTVRDLETNAVLEAPVTVRVVDTESNKELVATRRVNTAKDVIQVEDANFKTQERISIRFEFRSPTGDLEPATLDRVMNVLLPTGPGTTAPQTLIVVMPKAKGAPCYPMYEPMCRVQRGRGCCLFRR